MSNIVAQSLFKTTSQKSTWRTQMMSAAVHAVIIAAACFITFPVVRETAKPVEHVMLIAPVIPEYVPKIRAPQRLELPRLVVRTAAVPLIKPPTVQASTVKPAVVENTKHIAPPAAPVEHAILAEAPPPSLQPAKITEAVKSPTVPKIEVGGFGDPNAAHSSPLSRPAPVMMTRVGSFQSPEGPGQSGSSGQSDGGAIRSTSFGSADGGNGAVGSRARGGLVRTGGFGEQASAVASSGNGSGPSLVKSSGFGDTVAAAPRPKPVQTTAAAYTPVEILYKPRPVYSREARSMHVEGEVSLEVVFQASGAVKVIRVIRGLGHGLDEAAQQAALQVRFKPATRAGVAIDQSATISITFELT